MSAHYNGDAMSIRERWNLEGIFMPSDAFKAVIDSSEWEAFMADKGFTKANVYDMIKMYWAADLPIYKLEDYNTGSMAPASAEAAWFWFSDEQMEGLYRLGLDFYNLENNCCMIRSSSL